MSHEFARTLRKLAHRSASAERRAAVELHALPAPDRQWILQQLTAAHRTSLGRLLQELDALDRVDTGAAPSAPTDEVLHSAAVDTASDWAVTDRLDAPQAKALLGDEPDSLLADVLAQGPFRWQAQYPGHGSFEGCLSALHTGLSDAPVPAAPGARRRAIVLEELALRARALPQPSAGSEPATRSDFGWKAPLRRAIGRLQRGWR